MNTLLGSIMTGAVDPALTGAVGKRHISHDGYYEILWTGTLFNAGTLAAQLDMVNGWPVPGDRCDGEVALGAWSRWGPGAVERFAGTFAFCIIDRVDAMAYLVRDRFGTTSLYFAIGRHWLAFSSRLSPLLEVPGVSRKVNPQLLCDYFRSGITQTDQETLFQDVFQVPPGHYRAFTLDEPLRSQLVDYWGLAPARPSGLSSEQAAHAVREQFLSSVSDRLRNESVVASLLSGGIDSSSVVGALRYIRPKLELHTFSFVADNESLSEEQYIDQVAVSVDAISHKIRIRPEELLEEIGSLIAAHEGPLASTSLYAQYRVFRAASEMGFPEIFDGQGADEVLVGNYSFIVDRLVALICERKWTELSAFYKSVSRSHHQRGLLMRVISHLLPDALYAIGLRVVDKGLFPNWVNAKWFQDKGVGPTRRHARCGPDHFHRQVIREIRETTLPSLLRHIECNSRAVELNVVLPFLRLDLLQLIQGLSPSLLYTDDGLSKSPMRAAMRGLVPDAILDRRDKIGFEAPAQEWFRSLLPDIGTHLRHPAFLHNPTIRGDQVKEEWQSIKDGRRSLDSRVWRWMNFKVWSELFRVEF